MKDIVNGIYKAEIVIADLTGLNPNVFYEMGIAHGVNKKVIMLSQDIKEVPFDIQSYRVNKYSPDKLSELVDKLKKLLYGTLEGTVEYGNPLVDYYPGFDPQINSQIVEPICKDEIDAIMTEVGLNQEQ